MNIKDYTCFGCDYLQDINIGTNAYKDIEEYICTYPDDRHMLFGNVTDDTLWIDDPEVRPYECPIFFNPIQCG